MGQEELMNQIAELEREIAILPEGSITKKKIRDKELKAYKTCNRYLVLWEDLQEFIQKGSNI